eukprot:CAMPEP_0114353956 /NCGR_PEP_ID=MMETSP0101-20121206/19058_1 /TAXON_ID=38822 ORGANISM="Pteridomonas danica, Strain PT" /NCGR_SAMPLE_ID=MMETSP0101 /ASSEMBLY_ACC=CAM_ASM_000211 /LENGTH=468 /DNA_ID=CAMNT_0001495063 /DNA_START=642 /DNA_END=2048 /DNA_ORIENTATION=-
MSHNIETELKALNPLNSILKDVVEDTRLHRTEVIEKSMQSHKEVDDVFSKFLEMIELRRKDLHDEIDACECKHLEQCDTLKETISNVQKQLITVNNESTLKLTDPFNLLLSYNQMTTKLKEIKSNIDHILKQDNLQIAMLYNMDITTLPDFIFNFATINQMATEYGPHSRLYMHNAAVQSAFEMEETLDKLVENNILDEKRFTAMLGSLNRSCTMLMKEISKEDISSVNLLLKYGANLEISDEYGDTALMWAVDGHNETIVKLLLEAGADKDISNRYGVTPLISSANHCDDVIMKLLIDVGANIDLTDEDGDTALLHAVSSNAIKCVELLTNAGALLENISSDGKTALLLASYENNGACLKMLIDAGANIEAADQTGKTALMLGDYKTMTHLIHAGANINQIDRDGNTALMHLVIHRPDDKKCMKLLIKAGVKLDIKNKDGKSVFDLAGLDLDITELYTSAHNTHHDE